MKDFSFFPIEHNRYFYGKLLTVRDFEVEQNYAGIKRRLINRLVHGTGVVCGLGVSASDDTTLIIDSGMALDYLGREIVLSEPLIRKLEMIEGQGSLRGRNDAYLCLGYDETDIEPVNAVGGETGESQFNMTREGYKLFFSAEEPEYRSLLEAEGKENVSVIYSSDELTLVLYAPEAVCSGDEFEVNVLVIKNNRTMPVRFTIEGENSFIESEDGRLSLEYTQSPDETSNVIETGFRFRAQSLSGIPVQLFPNGVELNVELGNHKYKNFITVNADLFICENEIARRERLRLSDTLTKRLRGKQIPIYLAKLELINATDRVFVASVMNLPYGQALMGKKAMQSAAGGAFEITTAIRTLEYWQKPDIKASFNKQTGSMHFDFGIPTPEVYDYATSHGVVDMAMPGGVRVNARYVSEEIPHGLGAGNVDIRLSVEFDDESDGGSCLFGNSEVFKGKSSRINPPQVETAAVLYPSRGTMRIGVWLHDDVKGNLLRVHYYAQKPEHDTKRLLEKRKVSISVTPEVSRLARRGKVRFKATVVGSEDKNVIWRIKDEMGGEIDQNGSYQAPEAAGTYEIVACASADNTVTASAFVIVD